MAISKQQARNFLSNIPFINYGGCLIAALAFYLNEEKEGRGGTLQLVQLSNDESDVRHNKGFIAGKNKTAASDDHFGWTEDGGVTVFDCEKQINTNRYHTTLLIPKHLTEKFCISALNNARWNDEFLRVEYLPIIEKYFDLDLSKVYTKVLGQGWGCVTYTK